MLNKTVQYSLKFFKKVVFQIAESKFEPVSREFPNFTVEHRLLDTTENAQIGITIYTPKRGPAQRHFLFLHGTACNRDRFLPLFDHKAVLDLDIAAVTMDYREYGNSTGVFTKKASIEDVGTVLRFMHDFYGAVEITVYAHSMGTGIFLEYAANLSRTNSERLFHKVIIAGAFTSLIRLCETYYLWKFCSFLPNFVKLVKEKFDFDNLENIKSLDSESLLIVHAQHDDLIPHDHPLCLARVSKAIVVNAKTDHCGIVFHKDIWNSILLFLDNKFLQ